MLCKLTKYRLLKESAEFLKQLGSSYIADHDYDISEITTALQTLDSSTQVEKVTITCSDEDALVKVELQSKLT